MQTEENLNRGNNTEQKKEPDYIVVIGTSAGGFNALYELVSHLKPDMNAAYFIVLHLSYKSISSYLAHRLQDHTSLKCLLAMDDMPIRKGYIYVAVPNHHLLVTQHEVRLGNSPEENRFRPSVDVLFRSAAGTYSNRVIGVVLTGLMNDGTTGMSAIKRSGGITIVQDPNEAEYPDMPMSVLKSMDVDYVVTISEIAGVIEEITRSKLPEQTTPPDDLAAEAAIYRDLITNIDTSQPLGNYSPFTCPDCGGILFDHDQDSITKFKCHVGHSYTVRDLLIKQSDELEKSLWYAIRNLEQRKYLLKSLSEKYVKTGSSKLAADYQKRNEELEKHINNLKKVVEGNLDQPDED